MREKRNEIERAWRARASKKEEGERTPLETNKSANTRIC
jgi:hypothetical protein